MTASTLKEASWNPEADIFYFVQVIFVDPVVAADGESYERAAIEQWLLQHGAVSPATGVALDTTDLVSNYALRSTLGLWKPS